MQTESGSRTRRKRVRPRVVGLALAALASGLLTGPGATDAAAQEREPRSPWSVSSSWGCGRPWVALGIGGLRCTACALEFGEGAVASARFSTEPEVMAVEDVARGDRVRVGDRLVAVDGHLITTQEGVDRLLAVREGSEVTLTVRRDDRTRELDIVAGDACEVERTPLPAAPAPGAPRPMPSPDPARPLPPRADPAPLPAPSPPSGLPPRGHLGFGFSCSDCGIRGDRWHFSSPPTVTGVERDGPAWRAGIRTGDELVELGGHAIESEEGEEAFSSIEPGDRVRWGVRRDGSLRTFVMTAGEKADRPPREARPGTPPRAVAAGPARAEPLPDVLRYQGVVGDVEVEVRGAPVTVSVVEEAGEIVIRTSDALIRLRRREGG